MKYLPTKVIEKKALDLLNLSKAMDIPVFPEKIAKFLNLIVKYEVLGDDVSGLIVMKTDVATIGINSSHYEVRQRFTLAHEIGHYVLHKNASELFIDKKYNAFRDSRSSSGENRAEIQANQFAAALLMPEPLLIELVDKNGLDFGDSDILGQISNKFRVSPQALAYRLLNLGLLQSNDD